MRRGWRVARTVISFVSTTDDPYSDWARRLAAGDAGALRALFDAAHDPLVEYVGGLLRDDQAARDVVQDTFVRVWQHRATLDPARSLRALLYRTARNLAFNAVRDARTRARLLGDGGEATPDDVLPWAAPDPVAEVEAGELAERVRAAIAALPERQREALTLSRFDGLTHEEVADVMGCSARTVNNHLVRALATLRARLGVPAARESRLPPQVTQPT